MILNPLAPRQPGRPGRPPSLESPILDAILRHLLEVGTDSMRGLSAILPGHKTAAIVRWFDTLPALLHSEGARGGRRFSLTPAGREEALVRRETPPDSPVNWIRLRQFASGHFRLPELDCEPAPADFVPPAEERGQRDLDLEEDDDMYPAQIDVKPFGWFLARDPRICSACPAKYPLPLPENYRSHGLCGVCRGRVAKLLAGQTPRQIADAEREMDALIERTMPRRVIVTRPGRPLTQAQGA